MHNSAGPSEWRTFGVADLRSGGPKPSKHLSRRTGTKMQYLARPFPCELIQKHWAALLRFAKTSERFHNVLVNTGLRIGPTAGLSIGAVTCSPHMVKVNTTDSTNRVLLIGLLLRIQLEFVPVTRFYLSIYFWIKRLKNCIQQMHFYCIYRYYCSVPTLLLTKKIPGLSTTPKNVFPGLYRSPAMLNYRQTAVT